MDEETEIQVRFTQLVNNRISNISTCNFKSGTFAKTFFFFFFCFSSSKSQVSEGLSHVFDLGKRKEERKEGREGRVKSGVKRGRREKKKGKSTERKEEEKGRKERRKGRGRKAM